MDGVLGFARLVLVKAKISSLSEAIAAANAVAEYLHDLSATLGLSQMKGAATPQSLNGRIPDSMSDKVMKILSDMGKPMKPKAIVDRYEVLGWEAPEGGRKKLYEAVSGSLSYLLNRKKVLEKTKKGYSIKEKKE
jgi:hypothetical protein